LERSKGTRATRDTGQTESAGWPSFRVETLRWQRFAWIVAAENAREAERRFEMGMADGPISVEDDGQEIVEVTRMR
jgi:hypothetical protein